MSQIALVTAFPFYIAEYLGMPVVSDDKRRCITEKWRQGARFSLIAVKPGAVTENLALGNHYHNRVELFYGIGAGKLIVCDTNSADRPRETHELPATDGGWTVTITPGVAHAFMFSGTTPVTDDGAVAVLLSQTNWPYRGENDPDPNTFSFSLV